jgi:hypothetical protein
MNNCANGGGYANTLVALGTPPSSGGQPFISPDLGILGTITKSGYHITYAGLGIPVNTNTCVTAIMTASPRYFATGSPVSAGTTGTRFFATSEAQTLFQDSAAVIAIDPAGVPTPNTAVAIR